MRFLFIVLFLSVSFSQPYFSIGYVYNKSMQIIGFAPDDLDVEQDMYDSFQAGIYFLNVFGKNNNINFGFEYINEVNDDSNVVDMKIEGNSLLRLDLMWNKSINSNINFLVKLGLVDILELNLLMLNSGNFEIAEQLKPRIGYSYGFGILINNKIYFSTTNSKLDIENCCYGPFNSSGYMPLTMEIKQINLSYLF